MVVSAKDRLVSTPVCPACQPAVFRRVAGPGDRLGNGNVVLALLPVDLQSGHGVVVVSQPSDPRQSHVGRDRGELSRVAAGAGNVALLDRHRRLCPGSAAASRSLAGHAHATHRRRGGSGGTRSRGGGWGEPSSCSTARRSRCPTRRRTKRPIRRVAPKLPAWAFRWHASGCCFRCRSGPCWTWEFAAGRASSRANWRCSAT